MDAEKQNAQASPPSSQRKVRSLRSRLLLSIFLLLSLALGGFSALTYLSTYRIVEQDQEGDLLAIQDSVRITVEDFFKFHESILSVESRSPLLLELVQEMSAAHKNVLPEMVELLGEDRSWLKNLQNENAAWAEREILPLFAQVRGRKVEAGEILPLQDAAQILFYFYSATNPAPLGAKEENNHSSRVAANTSAPAMVRGSFALTSYARALDRFHPYYRQILEQYGLYDILIYDTDGNCVYSVEKETDIGTNVFNAHNSPLAGLFRSALDSVFADGKEGARVHFSNFVDYQPSYDAPSLFSASPIMTRAGTPAGVVIFQLNPENILRSLSFNQQYERVGLGRSGEVYLINEAGYFVTNPRRADEVPDATVKRPTVSVRGVQPGTNVALRLRDRPEPIQAAFGNAGLLQYTNYLGESVLAAAGTIQIPGHSLGLVVQIGEEELFKPVRELLYVMIAATIGALAIGTILAHQQGGSVTNSLRKLSETASAVAEGDLSVRSSVQGNDDVSLVARQFNAMLDNIGKRTEQNRHIMQTVSEALLLLDTNLIVQPEYSEATERILRKNLAGSNFMNLLRSILTDKLYNNARDFFDILLDPRKKERLIAQTNPLNEVEVSQDDGQGGFRTRVLEFRFNRVVEAGEIRQILVTVQDITSRVILGREILEAENRAKQQVDLLFGLMHVDPRQLKDFLTHAEADLGQIQVALKSEEARSMEHEGADERTYRYKNLLSRIYRTVHLVKGNAAVLQLGFFERQAHELENRIEGLRTKDEIRGEDFLEVTVGLAGLLEQLELMRALIGRLVSMNRTFGSAPAPTENAAARPVELAFNDSVPDKGQLSRFFNTELGDFVTRTAAKYGKAARCRSEGAERVRLAPAFEKCLIQIATQLVRNAVVHGIEPPAQRIAAGKPQEGQITVELSQTQDRMAQLVVRDDGAGLDYDAIRRRALDLSLADSTELLTWGDDRLAALIFQTGFSTATTVDEEAGRGVGLDAVKTMIRELHGKISLRSFRRQSCEFTIQIPL